MLEVFRSRRMASLVVLGFASGLPFYLTSRTLQAWMTVEGVDLTSIGLISLVGIPYSLKFLWSPLIDRFSLPFLGRRKGWLAVTQVTLSIAIATMALHRPATALALLAVNAVIIAFLSATQDIVVDAYSVDVLERHELGAGVGMKVLGFRVAMIVTGAVALIVADVLPWPTVYLLIAGLMFTVFIASTRVTEPVLQEPPPISLREAVRLPFMEFFQRNGGSRGLSILAFIILYRLGDSMILNMTTSFLLQTGFSQTDVGTIQGGTGLVATIVGILAGGEVLSRLGINRSLWILGGFQALSNFGYFALAAAGYNYPLMVAAVNIEKFCEGLGTAALVAFLMSLCNPRYSATQYALLTSVMAVTRDVIVAPAGSLVEMTGWPLFFLLSFIAALPGLMLLPIFAPFRSKI